MARSRTGRTADWAGAYVEHARVKTADTAPAVREQLADATRDALLKQMWDEKSRWFLSLRATDGAKSPAKEIIGL